MCGRYTITMTWDELLLRYYIDEDMPPFHTPRYNVAPTQMVPAVIAHEGKNRIGEMKWGLIPSWAKDPKTFGFNTINARAETITEKSTFKIPFQRKRCLMPADGFYEWKKTGKDKQPKRIIMKSGEIFSMAGLYDTWYAPDGTKVNSCTIITTSPNSLMKDIHDRMPVILRAEDEVEWLDRDQKVEQLQLLLRPYDAEEMRAYPVSNTVGNVKNQGAELIETI